MFDTMLSGARTQAGMSVAELARRSGTSRAAIADYEAGRKQPRFDTAERIMSVLGERIAAFPELAAPTLWKPTRAQIEALESHKTEPGNVLYSVKRAVATVLESDSTIEDLGFTFGDVSVVAEGYTIAGETRAVQRLWDIRNHLHATIAAASIGRPYRLLVVGDYLVEENAELGDVVRELDFLARATRAGADPMIARHLASASLASRGYSYLWVPYKRIDDYKRSVITCRRIGDADPMVEILLDSITEDGQ